jgi:hypothetical protein
MNRRSAARFLGAAVLAGSLIGCGGEAGRLPVYPVKGQVRLDGQPAEGAFVVLHPISGPAAEGDRRTGEPLKPRASVRADGGFEVSTYDAGDGAPVGQYAVTIEWPRLVKKGNDVSPGPNVIPKPYSDPKTTPVQVVLKEGAIQLDPIEIRSTRK